MSKEEPKKPIKAESQFKGIPFYWKCPNCEKGLNVFYDELPNESDAYCGCCGQKIDWGDVTDE